MELAIFQLFARLRHRLFDRVGHAPVAISEAPAKPLAVFFEPRYHEDAPEIWKIRGGNKYPSILGRLCDQAEVVILMSMLPPENDPHRQRLEKEHGVRFVQLPSDDKTAPERIEELVDDLAACLEQLGATLISNLNGRNIGYHYAMAVAASLKNVRFVQRVAGNDIEARAKNLEQRQQPFLGTELHYRAIGQERLASHMADAIIVMTERERVRVGARCADPTKIAVCFRGADQRHFWPNPRPRQRCRRFLFVGRQSFEKGYDILEGAMDLAVKRGCDVQLTFAGTFEKREQANRRYVGFVDYEALPALYREHDALILCSRSEGFPQVVMEAMSCGLPCLLTRHLFEHDFRHGVDCLLVEPVAEDVARAIEYIYRDSDHFFALQQSVRQVAAEKYSEENNRRLYQNVLLGVRPGAPQPN